VSSILLTGATGFLGRHILWDLLRQSPDTTVTCVLRPGRGSPARRLQRTLAAAGNQLPIDARDRCHTVDGDLADERLIADPATRERLVREVDRVVHCAASVQFETPLDKARSVNVGGTCNVLRFAVDAQASGPLRRVDHFSTSYVAGRAQRLMMEDELAPTSFTNTYEQTKWESEQLVREHQRDLPITIFRPSIVVGDSKTGYTSNFRVLYWPLKTLASGLAIVRPLLYATLWGKRRPLLRQAEQYFPYFAYRASFDTSIATADLAGSGIEPPAVADYFGTIVQYCLDTDWGKRRVPGSDDAGA